MKDKSERKQGATAESADEQSKKKKTQKFRISTLIHFNLFSHNSNNQISRKSKWKTKNHILVSRVCARARARVHTEPAASKQTKRANEQINQTNQRTIFCRNHLECFFTSHSLPAAAWLPRLHLVHSHDSEMYPYFRSKSFSFRKI